MALSLVKHSKSIKKIFNLLSFLAVQSSMPDFHKKMQGKLRTAEQGADTLVWLALAENVEKHPGGSFFQG